MGSGIAEVCARAGLDVVVSEVNEHALVAGKTRVETSLGRAVRSGKLDEAGRDAALGRMRVTSDLAEVADRQLVVEAVAENEEIKTQVFTTLDKVVTDPEAIFASNTSSIPIMKLGMATSRPQQVIGIHFFNPVPVLRLVELVPSLLTGETTKERADAFVENVLGKEVILSQDRAGFVVNALLVPYLLSAIRMLESGFASGAGTDTRTVQGWAEAEGARTPRGGSGRSPPRRDCPRFRGAPSPPRPASRGECGPRPRGKKTPWPGS